MTRFDAIKQMNIEDLAFFLSIIEWGDLNSIPKISNEDVNYYKNYLKEEDNDLTDALHKLNKSRHDYKEVENGNVDMKEEKEAEFHCGVEESGGHAYNCNDCPNKCEEWYQWDKEFKEKGDEE